MKNPGAGKRRKCDGGCTRRQVPEMYRRRVAQEILPTRTDRRADDFREIQGEETRPERPPGRVYRCGRGYG